jgi:alpha-galactosidase
VPLHPTDYNYAHLAVKQAFHHSLFHWIPYYGSNTVPIDRVDPYAIRSGYSLGMVFGYDMRRNDLDYKLLRKFAEQWRQIINCYYGDFYPLTPYSLEEENWIAWQFHHPERNEGIVQAFRRNKSNKTTRAMQLGGLDSSARYRLINLDKESSVTISGRELLKKGLDVHIPGNPGAVVIHYTRVRAGQ